MHNVTVDNLDGFVERSGEICGDLRALLWRAVVT